MTKAVKLKRKALQWNCQSFVEGKRCRSKAIIERIAHLGMEDFMFPVRLKLCMACSMRFSILVPRFPGQRNGAASHG